MLSMGIVFNGVLIAYLHTIDINIFCLETLGIAQKKTARKSGFF